MRLPEYDTWDAHDLAALVRAGEVTPAELLEAAIDRVEARNPSLNAVVARSYDRARARVSNGLPEGPMHGVPFLLKDLIEWEGAQLTMGCNLLHDNVADESHPWVERLEAAGAVILAQTNTPEMGLLPTTEPLLYGPTKNPWSPSHSPGGSSGGSAAAVAARIVPMAHANDGGGSIRIPASACGLFGLKPSRGRNPGSKIEPPDGYSVEHCVSRSVRDSALLLDITRGPRPGDRWWAPPPETPYADALGEGSRTLRVAFSVTDALGRVAHPECRAAVEKTAAVCEELGHQVVEAAPPLDGERYNEAFVVLWAAAAGVVFESVRREMARLGLPEALAPVLRRRRLMEVVLRASTLKSGRPALEPFTVRLARLEAGLGPADTWLAWSEMQRASRVMARFFEDHDVLLTPVLGEPPWPIGHLDQRGTLEAVREKLQRYVAYTPVANTSGLPAMSVPMHRTPEDLPVGVHFVAPFGDETTLFSLAVQLERARPWADALPRMLT